MMGETDQEVAWRHWTSAEDFYQERDHRTVLGVREFAAYTQRAIELRVDPEAAHDRTVQLLALVAVNLTARWARNVRVIVPEISLDPALQRDQYHTLGERLIAEMRAADPYGNFLAVSPYHPRGKSIDHPLRLLIGSFNHSHGIQPEDYLILASGWTALGRRGKSFDWDGRMPAAVPAAGVAAAIGVADLFKRAIKHPKQHWLPDYAWSTWSHRMCHKPLLQDEESDVPISLDFGRTLLAGVGAIGSAFLYLADMMPLHGKLTLLDRDAVETSNLNRSPLFLACHAVSGVEKTCAARDYLSHHGIAIQTVTGTWYEHGMALSQHPFDVWISLTNEDGAWAELPFYLPPVVVQATTTSGWGMGAGRHIPRLEDCTLCRLPRPESIFRGPCAEGDISPEEKRMPVRAALPFLSTGAAALLLAEYLKLGAASMASAPNEISADLRYGLPAVITAGRTHNPTCRGCAALRSKLWSKFGGRGRFAYLSPAT
jgi:hypothetical protein